MLLLGAALALAVVAIWALAPKPSAPPPKLPASSPPPVGRPVTITFAGDIMPASAVGRVAATTGAEQLLAGVSSVLRGDDLTIANLECAVSRRGAPADKQFTFRAAPRVLAGLRVGGIDAVSIANNHSLDYGRVALRDTMANLRRAGIAFAGAGEDLAEAGRPAFLNANGQTVALVAATRVLPTTAWRAGPRRAGLAGAYDPGPVLREIRAARTAADLVIIYLHWGKERALRPSPYQRTLARQCIDAGADLVVGAHPHVLQGFEYYRGRLIAYSLGNFVFTNRDTVTALLQTTFVDGKLTRAAVIPCRIVNYRPRVIADPKRRAGILADLRTRSFGVRVQTDGTLSVR